MNKLINALQTALNTRNWHAALFISLTLPDICTKLENPKINSSKRYPKWFNKYLGNKYKGFLSGNDCYALRCSYLHEGSDTITHQRIRDVIDHFLFVPEGSHCNRLTNCHFGDPKYDGKDNLQLSVKQFCEDFIEATNKWLADVKNNKVVQKRISDMLKIHENGITIGGMHIQ